MKQNLDKIQIYFMPGLAASSSIFEYIKLPLNTFEAHYLEWLVPKSNTETIENYALRMCAEIKHKNPILVGVSFGGIIVQEMSKHIKTKKVIIVSSVKSRKELPKRLKVAQKTKIYKLFPSKIVSNIENYTKYAFGNTVKKRVVLYNKYLSMRNEQYLNWAIHNVLHWQQKNSTTNVVHIHGNNDQIFPIKHIKNCITVQGGTHVMILDKSKKITTLIEEISLKN